MRRMRKVKVRGPVVYLLHFSTPYQHAGHYLGFSEGANGFFRRRILHHRRGSGAKLTRAAANAGVQMTVVRVWLNQDRHFERRLHKQRADRKLCPICSGAKAFKRGNAKASPTMVCSSG